MATQLTPSQIVGASFRTVRKGYDRDEVEAFLTQAAEALEAAQQQATAMEARARAAVTRLQEATATAPPPPEAAAEPPAHDRSETDAAVHGVHASPDEVETISRTLLLAQRTADTAVAEAAAEAEQIRNEARTEAEATIDSTREMSAQLLEDARGEARKVSEAELKAAENEVQSLKARREFLVGDVDQLESFLVDQRDRLRGAARQIEALVERVPAGLGQVRPPALSASDDEPGDDTAELFVPPEEAGPHATVDELAKALDQAATEPIPTLDLSLSEADDGAPDDGASDDGAPDDGAPDDGASDDGDPDDGDPDRTPHGMPISGGEPPPD